MTPCRPATWAAAALAVLATAPPARADDASCRRSPAVVAGCFTVHGRLSVWNGAPALRIWPIGTRRILGVAGEDGPPGRPARLPPGLEAAMRPPSPGALRTVFGDFRVCPLTRARPGRMQLVCIDRATHLAPAKDASGR